MSYDKLMYGKDETKHVVSVDIKNNKAHIFTENDGVVEEHIRDMKYWIVSNTMHGEDWNLLNGYNYYNYY